IEVLLLHAARHAVADVAVGIHDARHHGHACGVVEDVGAGRQWPPGVSHAAHLVDDATGVDLDPAQRRGRGTRSVDQRAVDDEIRHQWYSTPGAWWRPSEPEGK